MTLFRLDASFRVEGSHSRAIGDIVEQAWTEANPGADVVLGLSEKIGRNQFRVPS